MIVPPLGRLRGAMREAGKRFRPGSHLEARIDMAGIVTVYMHQHGRPVHVFRGTMARVIAGLMTAISAVDEGVKEEINRRRPGRPGRYWLN